MPRTSSSNNDLLRELAAARDEARVKLHLLSLDARDRWHEVEAKIDAFEHGLDRKGEAIGGWANSAARDLTQLIRAFVRAHQVDGEGLSMPVSAIMTREVRTCSPSDSLNHAAQILWEKNTGAIPVVGPGGALMGILTDRDICMARQRPLPGCARQW
jgi:CBS domain-containing protein